MSDCIASKIAITRSTVQNDVVSSLDGRSLDEMQL